MARQLSDGYLNDEDPDLGRCCNCETTEGVRNIVMLPRLGPIPGTGWGCVQCDLPCNGAVAVLCDECIELEDPPKFVCLGYAKAGERFHYANLAPDLFEHDLTKHPEERKKGPLTDPEG